MPEIIVSNSLERCWQPVHVHVSISHLFLKIPDCHIRKRYPSSHRRDGEGDEAQDCPDGWQIVCCRTVRCDLAARLAVYGNVTTAA